MRSTEVFFVVVSVLAVVSMGCASHGGNQNESADDVRQEVDSEFGELSEDHIDAFKRELQIQYRHLGTHYEEFDALRHSHSAANTHEDHRIHRKLKRRHLTLARLHEERTWLYLDDDGPTVDDRHLAEAHRAAAKWHDERFEEDGIGVAAQDRELGTLRQRLEDALE